MRIVSDGALTYVRRRGAFSDGSKKITKHTNNTVPPLKNRLINMFPTLKIIVKPQEDA